MSRSTKIILGRLGFIGCLGLQVSCSPRVATSFWRIGTEADSVRPGYTVIHAEGKTRHCYPISEWHASPEVDTYHQLHHHGVAVESELMAYRIYFDKKQTIDPYCKRSPQLELAKSYWYPNDSLLAAGFGDDILRVSGTVGVGSVKYWNLLSPITDNRSPLRHIEPVAERSERIVRQTRNSATIEVAVKDWQVEDKSVEMVTQYTMQAGHRDMRCDVQLSEPVSGLCTGVQSIPAKGPNQKSEFINLNLENGVLLASWGTDWPVNDSAKYAKETVGLAVFIPKAYAGELVHDKQNNLCLLNLTGAESAGLTAKRSKKCAAHFYLTICGATKENHPVATNATEWFTYLRRWAKHLH
ncbi:MAG: DUF4861 family protein [Paludibacteraceae bacterium]|nr:DUF4861 family protein [Paludibacteraceae bacterium]